MRIARKGNDAIMRGFIENAPPRSPWSSLCSARSEPQPGQWYPVSACNGHAGKTREIAGSKTNKITIAPESHSDDRGPDLRPPRTFRRITHGAIRGCGDYHENHIDGIEDHPCQSHAERNPGPHLRVLQSGGAPWMSPAATFEFTWAANTIAGIPKGRQQNTVTKIA